MVGAHSAARSRRARVPWRRSRVPMLRSSSDRTCARIGLDAEFAAAWRELGRSRRSAAPADKYGLCLRRCQDRIHHILCVFFRAGARYRPQARRRSSAATELLGNSFGALGKRLRENEVRRADVLLGLLDEVLGAVVVRLAISAERVGLNRIEQFVRPAEDLAYLALGFRGVAGTRGPQRRNRRRRRTSGRRRVRLWRCIRLRLGLRLSPARFSRWRPLAGRRRGRRRREVFNGLDRRRLTRWGGLDHSRWHGRHFQRRDIYRGLGLRLRGSAGRDGRHERDDHEGAFDCGVHS
jgi:hypothetical protein